MGWLFSALVIDDDPSARNILEKFLETDGRVNVLHGLESVVNAIEIIEKQEPDVIFLDINMPYEDGLHFATRLRQAGNNFILIFCTGFKNYALEAFELRPFDFLVKPFGIDEIKRVTDKIVSELSKRNIRSNKIWSEEKLGKYKFKVSNGFVFLKPTEILYFRCAGNFSELLTTSGEMFKVQLNISMIYEYLNSPQFFKVSRSAIVNIDYIISFEKKNRSCCVKSGSVECEFILTSKGMNELEDLLLIKLG
jgi:two-component system, LytTR family, response regulator